MDDKGYKPSEGSCIISEDVIATIASTAALEVQGVASMAPVSYTHLTLPTKA